MTSKSEGELCRVALIDQWLAANTTNLTIVQSLRALQETSTFAKIDSDCRSYMDAYDEAAGSTCLEERDGGLTYYEFWQSGELVMDAKWDIASNMKFTQNFTDFAFDIPCANSCYTKQGGVSGCEIVATYGLKNVGRVTQERVCKLGWSDLDNAYNDMRACVVESVQAGSVVVGAYKQQALSQKACSDVACQKISPAGGTHTHKILPYSVASSPLPGGTGRLLLFLVGAAANSLWK